MPWDCDSYWRPDPERDRDIWPVPPARHTPIWLCVIGLAAVAFVALAVGG